MRLLLALSGNFLPPASLWRPWGFLRDGTLLVEFPGVADLIGPERSEGPYIAPKGHRGGANVVRELVEQYVGAHPEDIPALCELLTYSEAVSEGAESGLDERGRGYEGHRTA
jgi:hypothetical protein